MATNSWSFTHDLRWSNWESYTAAGSSATTYAASIATGGGFAAIGSGRATKAAAVGEYFRSTEVTATA